MAASSTDLVEVSQRNFCLGGMQFITLTRQLGDWKLDIRQYSQSEEGMHIPTEDGIQLSLEQWENLKYFEESVSENLCKILRDPERNCLFIGYLGNRVSIAVKSELKAVDIRLWYQSEDGSMKRSSTGILLTQSQWDRLLIVRAELDHYLPYDPEW